LKRRIQETESLFTENFRQLLPSNYQYTFIDGEYEAAPAPGIDNVFPGPYRRYLPDNSVESTAEQHGFISEIIAEEGTRKSILPQLYDVSFSAGPFDGVLAFSQVRPFESFYSYATDPYSQGASLIASSMLTCVPT
jgi:hypothetical protein